MHMETKNMDTYTVLLVDDEEEIWILIQCF